MIHNVSDRDVGSSHLQRLIRMLSLCLFVANDCLKRLLKLVKALEKSLGKCSVQCATPYQDFSTSNAWNSLTHGVMEPLSSFAGPDTGDLGECGWSRPCAL